MKVTFVYPDQVEKDPSWRGHFYYGIGMLSSVLKKAGIETSLIHVIRIDYTDDEFRDRLLTEKPDLLCFSCTTFAFRLASRLARLAKTILPEVPVICGGLHPTISPEAVIADAGFDMLCRGEGEGPLLDLCAHLAAGTDYTGVPNLWVRKGGQVFRNPIRPLEQDLNAYPFPDRTIFDYPNLHHESGGWGTFMLTRGCAHRCTYCANAQLQQLYPGQKYVRHRSVDNIITEIRETVAAYPFIKRVHFDDDLPFINSRYIDEFCREYKRQIGLPFRFNLRPKSMKREDVLKLKDAGGVEVKIGLETGNETIMNEVLKRNLSVAAVEEIFAMAHEAGLATQSFNMVGLPEETPLTVLDTIKLNARVNPGMMQVSIFFPFPGTPLEQYCRERGWLPESIPVDFFSRSVLPLPTITREEVFFFHKHFYQLVKLYRAAYARDRGAGNGMIRTLDRLLTCRPTRQLVGLTFDTLLPLYRFFRERLRSGNRPEPSQAGTTA